MNTQASLLTVTRELVPEDRRMDVVEQLFGTAITLQLEEGDAGGYGLRATRHTCRHLVPPQADDLHGDVSSRRASICDAVNGIDPQ